MSDNLETYFDLSLSRTFAVKGATVAPPDFSPSDAAAHFKRGTVLDQKYRIIQLLGEGGMGAVYSAHHLSLNKDVALKTFRSRQVDAAAFQRFAREAQAIARLSHPNIVQVFDFGMSADHRPFYTMELLDGVSLAERIFKNPLSLRQTVRIFIDVAAGLAHAHKIGIIHRDVKPANIHLCEVPERPGEITAVKVVDFGIAKLAFGEEAEPARTGRC
ncbi:MAG: serine/threonine protein kinase [Cyanobacteria bacterium REEB67]|nr:serine/threonine protein kinase [Cyanobacteria bacterium REEB67]